MEVKRFGPTIEVTVPALFVSFVLPLKALKNSNSSYFTSALAQKPLPSSITVHPPDPQHFYDCMMMAIHKFNLPVEATPRTCMDIYKNAVFLGMEGVVDQCCNRFAAARDDLGDLPDFTYQNISFEHLTKIIHSIPDELNKLTAILIWGRGINEDLQGKVKELVCSNEAGNSSTSLTPPALHKLLEE
ncbi:hypothetical protein HDV00_011777 [Rhizophlyctis rosea]|nr:hypothetical protein HDV00_011777 [Rhizophlyctis rosea]